MMLHTNPLGVAMIQPMSLILGLACCLYVIVPGGPVTVAAQQSQKTAAVQDISGTYAFLREGEFVQLTVDDGKLSGYISRFGDSESDKGQFIDQFFDKTTLVGDRLTFNTKTVHGIWYDFNGRVSTVSGKQPDEEGYRVMKGMLVEHATDANGAEKAQQRQVEFKSFPSNIK